MLFSDEYFMREALKEARLALSENEIPIGAVIVANNMIIGRGYNQTERLNDVTAHAEMLAFTAATQNIGGKYLRNCTLYVSVEPCPMCAGASYWTQVSRIVYGTEDEKRGYSAIAGSKILHPKTEVVKGILQDECRQLMQDYFRKLRE